MTENTLNAGASNALCKVEPKRNFKNLILPKDLHANLKEFVSKQTKSCQMSNRINKESPQHRVLFTGASGSGKTSLAKAIAKEINIDMFSVNYGVIMSGNDNDPVGNLRKIFASVKEQKCVLFFDGFETLGLKHGDSCEPSEFNKMLNPLSEEIDKLPLNVVVIAAASHSKFIDPSLCRRFQIHVELALPTEELLVEYFVMLKKEWDISSFLPGYSNEELAKKIPNASYADARELFERTYKDFTLRSNDDDMKKVVDEIIKNWKTMRFNPK